MYKNKQTNKQTFSSIESNEFSHCWQYEQQQRYDCQQQHAWCVNTVAIDVSRRCIDWRESSSRRGTVTRLSTWSSSRHASTACTWFSADRWQSVASAKLNL